MILPFAVDQVKGDVGDSLPGPLRVESSPRHQAVQVRIIPARTTGGLQHHNRADVEIPSGASYSRSPMGLFIFNGLRDFSLKAFVNFLPVRP